MKKWENKDFKDTKMGCWLKIELEDDGITVGLFGKSGKEQLFADFLSKGLIATLEKVMDWMELPDGLKAKLYGKWVEQIGKKITNLDLDNDED